MSRKLTKILLVLIVILIAVSAVAYIKNSGSGSGQKKEDKQVSDSFDNNVTEVSEAPADTSSPEEKPSSFETDPVPANNENVNDSDEKKDDPDESYGQNDETKTGDSLIGPIVLAFAGDVNLDENSKPVARYDKENKGILGVFSQDLVDEMNNADIFMLNNEFAYSTRGARIKEKSFTFRAHPKRVEILKEMGADIVSLANNHALDYGVDALLDTFTTLEEAGIDYVGAGRNMERAKAPVYYTIGDKTIGFVAASRVIYAMDWYATDDRPGMIGTYDPALFVTSIKEAKENSDYVVAFVHWGIEREHKPVEYQKVLAKTYIDAGADFVIGCHPHVMQGIEFYKGKPIAYSLGNYWFNSSKRESGLLKIYINPDGTFDVQLLPVMNDNTYTYMITDEKEKEAYYKFMTNISFNVEYDKDGFVTEKQ